MTRTGSVERGRYTDALLEPMRSTGDPVADVVVGGLFASEGVEAVNELLRTFVHDADPDPAGLPPEVAAYLDATIALPDWADTDRIGRAERMFQVWGPQITLCLFCASLPSAYACANGAQVLRLTARLETDTRRRIMETGQFLMDVMAPGGLGRGGDGLRTIQRVRLMHAAVRHLILGRAAADPTLWRPEWGHPINQEDLSGTLMSFAYVPARPLRRLGVHLSDSEQEDYLHAWKVVGHQLGLHDELLPADMTEAGHLVAAIEGRQTAPSEAGRELTAALVVLLDELIPTTRADAMVPALIRHLSGSDVADMLGVPSAGRLARLLLVVGQAINRLLHALDDDWDIVIEPLAEQMLAVGFRLERGGDRPSFSIPTELAEAWGIDPS